MPERLFPLRPIRPTEDIESGRATLIPAVDGTVSDPEPRRTVPKAEAKPERTPKSSKNHRYKLDGSPGFKSFVRTEWPDFVLLLTMSLVPLAIYYWASPLTRKYFRLDVPEYGYPQLPEFVPTWLSAVMSIIVPILVIVFVSMLWIGSFWDCHSALMGYSYALTTATLFQCLIKWIIGGLRPNFYHVCQPHPAFPGLGYAHSYHTPEICRGNRRDVNIALMAFPSGHSSAAFASFVFLALWINAKFKVFADYQSRYWQQLLLALPIVVASLLALSKTVDYWHHWYDVLVGCLIGTFFAWASYRQKYHAVFDYRYNHIPTPYPQEKEYKDRTTLPMPRRDLTAINYAGWENRRSKERGYENNVERTQ